MELNTSPPKWTTALPDWERRIIAGESIVPVKPLYPVMANRAVAFYGAFAASRCTGAAGHRGSDP